VIQSALDRAHVNLMDIVPFRQVARERRDPLIRATECSASKPPDPVGSRCRYYRRSSRNVCTLQRWIGSQSFPRARSQTAARRIIGMVGHLDVVLLADRNHFLKEIDDAFPVLF
jgi:hypothetical protein